MRISRRLGRLQSSFAFLPEPRPRAAAGAERVQSRARVASYRPRDLPHSQRTTRSPGRRSCRARRARAAAGSRPRRRARSGASRGRRRALRAGADEAGGDDRAAVEAALLVERLAVDQPAGALALLACRLPPARRTTRETARRRCPASARAGSFESGGGAKSLRRRDARHDLRACARAAARRSPRGRSIFGQVSRPPTIAECLGRSISAPGP